MYIIQELQTNNGITAFLPAEQKATRPEAESLFYTKCGSACISNVEKHTIMTYTEEGFPIPELTKCFKHSAQPAPTPEQEPEQEQEPESEPEEPGDGE